MPRSGSPRVPRAARVGTMMARRARLGIVWMMLVVCSATARARLLRADQIPSGTPIASPIAGRTSTEVGDSSTRIGKKGAITNARTMPRPAAALAAFRGAMLEAAAWRRCLVMTYAEFGRRVAEALAGETDIAFVSANDIP